MQRSATVVVNIIYHKIHMTFATLHFRLHEKFCELFHEFLNQA